MLYNIGVLIIYGGRSNDDNSVVDIFLLYFRSRGDVPMLVYNRCTSSVFGFVFMSVDLNRNL